MRPSTAGSGTDSRSSRRRRRLLAASAALWALSFAAEARVTVALRRRAEAEGKLVSVQDVARVEGDEPELVKRVASVLLGAAPEQGDIRTIGRHQVKARLFQEGISLSRVSVSGERVVAVLPPRAVSRREEGRAFISSGQGAASAVGRYVAGELRCPAGSLEVDLVSLQWLEQPAGPARVKYAVLRRTRGAALGRSRYLLEALRDGRRAGRAIVWTDVVLYRKGLAARREIAADRRIKREDVFVISVPVRDRNMVLVTRPEEAVGRKAARSIAPEEPLVASVLRERAGVEAGQLVTVIIETRHCKIADRARAARSGAVGEVIPVLNVRSGKTYLARVIEANLVAAVP